jgi:hypothetical protein
VSPSDDVVEQHARMAVETRKEPIQRAAPRQLG